MLVVFIVLSILSIASATETANETASCTPPANDMKTLEECCHSPILFEDDLHGTCEFFCSEDKKESKNPDCSLICLFKNNGIMKKNEINTTALENTYDKFGLANPNWRPITASGIAKCPLVYVESKFKENVEKFEKCMTDNYRHHCIEYNPDPDCDKVEDFMNKCQNVQADCNTWPRWIVKLPEKCCHNKPLLFNNAMMKEAERFCKKQDIVSNLGTMQCHATFLINATGVKADGKWHFPIATKLLNDHSGNDPKWTSAIEKTVETCEKLVHEDEQAGKSVEYVDFWFYECVKGSLADFCPEYILTKKECRRIKKFKEACPNAVPPRKTYMVNGKM